jgi:hypothetical protein
MNKTAASGSFEIVPDDETTFTDWIESSERVRKTATQHIFNYNSVSFIRRIEKSTTNCFSASESREARDYDTR